MKTYLTAGEYERYGIDAATPEALVGAASALVDAHCRRPSLLAARYTERFRMQPGQRTVRVSYLPLLAVPPATSALETVKVRYRGGSGGEMAEAVAAFGMAEDWSEIAPATVGISGECGDLDLPGHPLGLAHNEVEVAYTAGFEAAPEAVKFACAQLVRNAQAMPALNVRAAQVSSMQMQYFTSSLVDETVRALLAPFVSQKAS